MVAERIPDIVSWQEARQRDRAFRGASDALSVAEELAAVFKTKGKAGVTVYLDCATVEEYRALDPAIWEPHGEQWKEIGEPEKGRSHLHACKRMKPDVLGELARGVIVYATYSRWGTVEESKGWEAP